MLIHLSLLSFLTTQNKPQSRGSGTQWHADLGIVNSKLISNEFKRTRSEVSANLPPHPSKERTLNGKEITFRPRSKSGDSATMSRHYGIESSSDVGVANGDVGVAKDEVDGGASAGTRTSEVHDNAMVILVVLVAVW